MWRWRFQSWMRLSAVAAGFAAPVLLILAACNASVARSTATPEPTTSPQRTERVAAGQAKFIAVGCAACHGDRAEGGIGPRASGTTMRLPDLRLLVRSGQMNGVKYDEAELTDQDIAAIYLWLQTNPVGD